MKSMKYFKTIILSLTLIFVILAGGCGNQVNTNPKVAEKVVPSKQIKTEKTANDKNPIVTIEMVGGSIIKIELYPEIAPNTVRNFVSLVRSGFYNGLIFHRVVPGFMIQGGDPEGTGGGGPGYAIAGEFTINKFNNALKHERGVISMARTEEPNTAGSQFFIVVKNSSFLDTKYAAFGKVTKGMETVDKIVSVETGGSTKPKIDQKMKKVTIDTFGVKYGEVQKIK